MSQKGDSSQNLNSPSSSKYKQQFQKIADKIEDMDLDQAQETFNSARTKEESESALIHTNHVYELIQAAQQILNSFKQENQELRDGLNSLKETIEAEQEDVKATCKPKLEYLQSSDDKGTKTQSEINKIFQLSIAQEKKDHQGLQQDFIKSIDRMEKQETVLGKYKFKKV